MDDKSQKNIINVLYFILVASTIASTVPSFFAQIASLVMIVFVLIAAYWYQSRDSEDGLLHNHMTYLIGTVWIGTSAFLIAIIIAGLWVYMKGDQSAIDAAAAQILSGTMPDESYIHDVIMTYINDNKRLLILSSLVAIGPAVIYFIYRVANGYGRAIRGYRIAKPKSWL